MEDQNSNTKKEEEATLCEECKEKASKYKCPGCSIRTCSLPCVKSHKQRTACSGKRSLTHFVPLSRFDESILLSDYNLLEETKRVAESAERLRGKVCGAASGFPYFKLPYNLRSLKSAAGSRRTKVLFLPTGMTRREKNQTRYDQRKKLISWTIEWRLHSTDVVLVDHGVQEDTTLYSVIEKHLKHGPCNHQLRPFCEEQLDCLKFFIRKYPKGPKSPFRVLDLKSPIRQQLSNVVLLEYPIIYVFLPSHSYDFEVVKDCQPVTRRPMHSDAVSNVYESHKGIAFREEEIEEDVSTSDTRVLDLMKPVKSTQGPRNTNKDRMSEKVSNNSDSPSFTRLVAGNGSHSSPKADEPGVSEDMFDFDQGLIDAYSNLFAEINPDDFLDFEGIFAKEAGVDVSNMSGGYFGEEEMEEGEIAE
ncbi:hypothetical protein LWI28_002515 [Acer negundo]|uniref:Box C/D snoRNA protein 1 n=1 Tax=Acer negundo TaxID=4023 RepID=A0AAD5NMP2_ACENE|nr:hypothetical protein LWI28_002515 [Acer negundo]KAK4841602.1 hypothetical protein QYF36_007346 [Acer negundo]